MATDIQQTPFIKQLAATDRPTRDKALASLQTYLTSGRTFTYTELLKVWKGLFFCVHHTANPLPQQRLSDSLASLLLALPNHVFIPFLSAFFQTIISYWSSIPALRLDKYLYLIRLYISHSFIYLSRTGWEDSLVDAWAAMMVGQGECAGVLDPTDGKVGDGLRYHVMDVWIDGLVVVEDWKLGVENGVLGPVEGLTTGSQTRTVRERAKGVLKDERLGGELPLDTVGEVRDDEDDEEFSGFED